MKLLMIFITSYIPQIKLNNFKDVTAIFIMLHLYSIFYIFIQFSSTKIPLAISETITHKNKIK